MLDNMRYELLESGETVTLVIDMDSMGEGVKASDLEIDIEDANSCVNITYNGGQKAIPLPALVDGSNAVAKYKKKARKLELSLKKIM